MFCRKSSKSAEQFTCRVRLIHLQIICLTWSLCVNPCNSLTTDLYLITRSANVTDLFIRYQLISSYTFLIVMQ